MLIDDRPHDITAAYTVLARRPRMFRRVSGRLETLDATLLSRLAPLLSDISRRG